MSFKNDLKTLFFITILLLTLSPGGVCSAGTFGYADDGDGGFGTSFDTKDLITGSKFTLSTTSDILSITTYIDFGSGTSKVKTGIYDNSKNLVAESPEYINTLGDIAPAWYTFTFPSQVELEAGNYWLVFFTNTIYAKAYEEAGSTLENWQSATTTAYNGMPASWDALYNDVNNIVIYATYRDPYITIPISFATNTLAYAGQLFTDLSIPIILTIGLPMAFWIIKKIILLV